MTGIGADGFTCVADHCITCSDEAIPMTVIVVDDDQQLAVCEAQDGSQHTIEIALVGPVSPLDCVLAHAGTAIGHVRQGGW